MSRDLSRDDIQRLARIGAQARLDEIEAEKRAILRAFPGIRFRAGHDAVAPAPAEAAAAPPEKGRRRRRRRSMSAAQKKAASERMKKLWAERKQAE